MESQDNTVASQEPSMQNAEQLKGVLAEARNTRDMLVGFRSAVEDGQYHGSKMLDIARGLAFVNVLLQQNNSHIHNLQERIENAKQVVKQDA